MAIELPKTIKVNYSSSRNVEKLRKLLEEDLKDHKVLAFDFETASRYTAIEREQMQEAIDDPDTNYFTRKALEAALRADGLSHPSHVAITHLNIAWSDNEAFVAIVDSDVMFEYIMEYLTTTDVKQIWHNATFDFKHIFYHTGTMPKDYEDTEVYAKTILNHVENHKAKTGLKHLAGKVYGDWAIASDQFTLDQMYDEKMIKYAATDACATYWAWEQLTSSLEYDFDDYKETADRSYSPWSQLPAPEPCDISYHPSHFYYNTAKFLVRDTVRLMGNGLPTNLDKVKDLEDAIESQLEEVMDKLHKNEYVAAYLDKVHKERIKEKQLHNKEKLRPWEYYVTEYDPGNATHKSYYMNVLAEHLKINKPKETYPTGAAKWSHSLIKKLGKTNKVIQRVADKEVKPDSKYAIEAMKNLAIDKAATFNEKYLIPVTEKDIERPQFNPGSAKQKRELFEMLDIESDETSKTTGDASWSREQIERVNRETSDPVVKELTELLIEHSFAAIIGSTFVPAFYEYTVDGRLYGNYRLLGAKSGRFTSNNPNMLNMPSSRSIFSKPVKKCFTAPEGFIVAAIDYAALEDRVMANLSRDENKIAIFLEGIDGHSMACCSYWPKESDEIIGRVIPDLKEKAKEFKRLVDAGNEAADSLRGRGKGISFGLAYGCFPPKVAKAAKIPLPEATDVFNNYHHVMFPGITHYRENYVLKTADRDGSLHLGLGFSISTDNASRDIRTLTNGTCQVWSMLTILVINELHRRIDEAGYSEDILVTSSIYDSIYFIVRDDIEVIQWLNEQIIPIMEQDFMLGQIVHNSADLEIGPDWATLHTLPHNASKEQISEIRQKF